MRTALVAREGAADLAVVVAATDAGEAVAARRTWSPAAEERRSCGVNYNLQSRYVQT